MLRLFPVAFFACSVRGLGMKTQEPTMSDLVDMSRNAEALGPCARVRGALGATLLRLHTSVRRCVRESVRQATVGRREQQGSYGGKRRGYGSHGIFSRAIG